jgi:hypothetical protein
VENLGQVVFGERIRPSTYKVASTYCKKYVIYTKRSERNLFKITNTPELYSMKEKYRTYSNWYSLLLLALIFMCEYINVMFDLEECVEHFQVGKQIYLIAKSKYAI